METSTECYSLLAKRLLSLFPLTSTVNAKPFPRNLYFNSIRGSKVASAGSGTKRFRTEFLGRKCYKAHICLSKVSQTTADALNEFLFDQKDYRIFRAIKRTGL